MVNEKTIAVVGVDYPGCTARVTIKDKMSFDFVKLLINHIEKKVRELDSDLEYAFSNYIHYDTRARQTFSMIGFYLSCLNDKPDSDDMKEIMKTAKDDFDRSVWWSQQVDLINSEYVEVD